VLKFKNKFRSLRVKVAVCYEIRTQHINAL
jgi:hypothetical protein